MNIAILIPALRMGGAERVAAYVGDYYHDKGHKVYYFLLANSGHEFFSVKGEIVKTHVWFSSGKDYSENIWEMLLGAKTIKKLKKKYQIDVAISFMEACNYINICSKGKEKVFVSVHTVLSERKDQPYFLVDERVIRTLYKRADQVIAVSDYVKGDLSEIYKIPGKKIVVIPNVPVFHKSMYGGVIPWEYGDKAILCVGRLDPIKQHQCIIRAFSYVHNRRPDARLIIVGDGQRKDYLKSVSEKMGLEGTVVFTGASADVRYFYRHAKALVMSSRVEGFGNVLIEAMAYGVPVVTTDSPGGCGEIVGKEKSSDEIQYCEYGILTPYVKDDMTERTDPTREEELLGAAMLRLLEDNELYREYSDKSRKRADDFSENKIMALWDKVLFH